MRLPRTRTLLKLATLPLLLGALTTIAAAWIATALPTSDVVDARTVAGQRPRTAAEGPGSVSCQRVTWPGCTWYSSSTIGYKGSAPQRSLTDIAPETVPPAALRSTLLPWCSGDAPWPALFQVEQRHVLACGWPLRALTAATASRADGSQSGPRVRAPTVLHGLPVPRPLWRYYDDNKWCDHFALLPTHPLWPGFALDTLLFAAAWLSLFTAIPAARRALRRRRGHCPSCNYDRLHTFTTPCPECGAVTTAHPHSAGVSNSAKLV